MIDLNGCNKLLTDKEILEIFAELFKKYIQPESYHEVLTQMEKDFLNAITVISYIIGQDDDYVKGYIKAYLRKK